jgi:hypothetical protein
VELRTRKREMRWYGGNHHEKLGRKIISCASQLTIPERGARRPDLVCNFTDMRLFQPNLACRTTDYYYPLVSSILFSSSSPISLFLVHYSTIIAEHKVKSSLSISLCHDHEWAPSIAYTAYSIHWVQHTPNTASIEDCLSSLHSHDYELTAECSFSFRRTSPFELIGKVTLSDSHGCELTK